MQKEEISKGMKIGFVCLMLANLLFAFQLFSFMNSIVASVMDVTGWLFFITSCVSHAACLALIPFLLLFLPLCLLGQWRVGGGIVCNCNITLGRAAVLGYAGL